ncbi:hypothetical protein EV644_104350 [Kribbella orskensis]|uniref:Uncharacterized protein n=1 Tax=Kribbella orskensis TaxID=2512216 RepID=A0ABY2BP21_9ACTN|nr:hypothetical protein EV642_103350 [Kribbella sp. VKM Ac-2500]TCO25846.1 hypothetical protein EV644_104350 [Kribbella orskensis]
MKPGAFAFYWMLQDVRWSLALGERATKFGVSAVRVQDCPVKLSSA